MIRDVVSLPRGDQIYLDRSDRRQFEGIVAVKRTIPVGWSLTVGMLVYEGSIGVFPV